MAEPGDDHKWDGLAITPKEAKITVDRPMLLSPYTLIRDFRLGKAGSAGVELRKVLPPECQGKRVIVLVIE